MNRVLAAAAAEIAQLALPLAVVFHHDHIFHVVGEVATVLLLLFRQCRRKPSSCCNSSAVRPKEHCGHVLPCGAAIAVLVVAADAAAVAAAAADVVVAATVGACC